MDKIFTIGFAGKSAERFFTLLRDNGVKKIIDTRLHPTSQLSGFARGKDLAFFARELTGIRYEHKIEFAPTEELLSGYRLKDISWEQYEAAYLELIKSRNVLECTTRAELQDSCLLCSEHDPKHCHRRILALYLAEHFQNVSVIHLV